MKKKYLLRIFSLCGFVLLFIFNNLTQSIRLWKPQTSELWSAAVGLVPSLTNNTTISTKTESLLFRPSIQSTILQDMDTENVRGEKDLSLDHQYNDDKDRHDNNDNDNNGTTFSSQRPSVVDWKVTQRFYIEMCQQRSGQRSLASEENDHQFTASQTGQIQKHHDEKMPLQQQHAKFPKEDQSNQNKSNVLTTIPDWEQEWWWPTNASDWRLRTPYFMVIGAKKAGTTALYEHLKEQRSYIVKPRLKELLYFLPNQFSPKKYWKGPFHPGEVEIDQIRHELYSTSKDYYFRVPKLQRQPNAVTYEATPGYLLFSTLSRIPILCTFPWVKILVILRDPISRSFSNYNFLVDIAYQRSAETHITNLSFEDYVKEDIQRLHDLGVIPSNNDNNDHDDASNNNNKKNRDNSFYGSIEEREAWLQYQLTCARSGCHDSPVARSLYVLQLEEWYEGLRQLGRDPTESIMVVRNEDLKEDPERIITNIFQWLGVASSQFTYSPVEDEESMVTTYRRNHLSNKTRTLLSQLYEPYNQRLYRLLGWNTSMQWR